MIDQTRLADLATRLAETPKGRNVDLDSDISDLLVPGDRYTCSLDAGLNILKALLPDWIWSVSSDGTATLTSSSTATYSVTSPVGSPQIALLQAIVAGLIAEPI